MNMWTQLVCTTPKVQERSAATTQSILEYIQNHPGCLASDIRDALGITTSATQDKLQSLEKRRKIFSVAKETAKRAPNAPRNLKHFWVS